MNSLTYRPRLQKDLLSKFRLGLKTGTIRKSRQNSQLIHNPLFSKFVNPLDLPLKSTMRALFKAKSVDQKTYSPPSRLVTTILNLASLCEIPSLPGNEVETRGEAPRFRFTIDLHNH